MATIEANTLADAHGLRNTAAKEPTKTTAGDFA
jgi:hypothetical protein